MGRWYCFAAAASAIRPAVVPTTIRPTTIRVPHFAEKRAGGAVVDGYVHQPLSAGDRHGSGRGTGGCRISGGYPAARTVLWTTSVRFRHARTGEATTAGNTGCFG